MANYKLITHESQGQTSELMFTAGGTNTVVSSITAKDGSGQTAEVLVQKSGVASPIEMAEVSLTSNAGFQIIDVAFALEAGDKIFIRATRGGMKFIMSYVEETELPNDTNLGGLADVDLAGVADGDVIAYSSSAGVWQPVAAGTSDGTGATELDGLSDVTISSASNGKFLLHNGSKFVDQNFASQVASTATVLGHTTKLNHITVTQAVDLDQMETDLAAVAGMHYTSSDFDNDLSGKTTADLAEDSGSKYYTEARVSANADVAANSNKVGITPTQAGDITTNNSKISFTEAAAVTANSNKVSADGSVTTHSDVTNAGSGAIITSVERTKLGAIADDATANDTDANLKNRANHTGTQPSSTISDFTAEVETIINDQIGNTGDLNEGSNLYHTSARVDARIGLAKIEDLDEVSNVTPSTGQVLKWSGSEWAPAADNSSSGGAGGVVDSVNGISQAAVVLDTDNILDTTATNKYTTAAEITKLAGIANNATANDTDINLKNRSNHTGQQASTTISDFGAASAAVFAAADLQSLYNVDPSPTTGEFLKWDGGDWVTAPAGGGAVDSVNTQTGVVVLDADDIDDASTTHKFVTAADVTTLGNITAPSAVNLDTINLLAGTAFSTANSASSAVSNHATSLRNHGDIDYTEANPSNIPVGSLLCWQGSEWKDQEVDLQDLANVDTPTTGEFLKWNGNTWETESVSTGGGGGVVNSVNGISQATVVLDPDDLDDASTTHKFVTAGDVTKLGHISVANAVNLDNMDTLATLAFTTANAASGEISQHENSLRNHSDINYSDANPANIPTGSLLVWQGTAWEDEQVTVHDGNYNTLTNVPADFTPSAHTHVAADITDFATAVDARIPASSTTVHDADTSLPFNGSAGAGAEKMDFTTTSATLGAGRVFKLGSTGWEATSNTDSSMEVLLAICPFGSNDGSGMILKGAVKVDLNTASASIGDPVYLGTGSKFVLSAPTSNAYVMKMGYVLDTSGKIFFDPDSTSIKVQ